MRARNIKPGFYKDEKLVECSIWARLLAPGLWMLADREGRLLDKPKQIKMEIFPADSVEVDPLLAELHAHGHIKRYEIDGVKYIQILGFKEHQSPHFSEKESIHPPHINTELRKSPSSSQDIPQPQPPDSLNPDSLNPELESKDSCRRSADDACPAQEILSVWNEVCGGVGLPKAEITKKRRITLKTRWNSEMKRDMQRWRDFCGIVSKSNFHRGENERSWKANIDWALRPDNITKIFEASQQTTAKHWWENEEMRNVAN